MEYILAFYRHISIAILTRICHSFADFDIGGLALTAYTKSRTADHSSRQCSSSAAASPIHLWCAVAVVIRRRLQRLKILNNLAKRIPPALVTQSSCESVSASQPHFDQLDAIVFSVVVCHIERRPTYSRRLDRQRLVRVLAVASPLSNHNAGRLGAKCDQRGTPLSSALIAGLVQARRATPTTASMCSARSGSTSAPGFSIHAVQQCSQCSRVVFKWEATLTFFLRPSESSHR